MNTEQCDQVIYQKHKAKQRIQLVPDDIAEVPTTEKDSLSKIPDLKKTSKPKELIDIEAMSAFSSVKEQVPAQ